jgi:hypothetical protein
MHTGIGYRLITIVRLRFKYSYFGIITKILNLPFLNCLMLIGCLKLCERVTALNY